MFKVKIFQGSHVFTKIFYFEFFNNEIFSFKKFPNYGILSNKFDIKVCTLSLTTTVVYLYKKQDTYTLSVCLALSKVLQEKVLPLRVRLLSNLAENPHVKINMYLTFSKL